MARKHNLAQAEEEFGLAATLAGDGGILGAGIHARRGMEALEKEWKRRAPLRAGIIADTGMSMATISLAEAVNGEIRRLKARKAVA